MQNLLSDIHPEFSTPEESYIAEFDVNANGYDHRVGPCGNHKQLVVNAQAHPSGWVPLEEILEEDLHPDFFTLTSEVEDEDIDNDDDFVISIPASQVPQDRYYDMWVRYGLSETSEPTPGASVTLTPASASAVDEELVIRDFNAFPGIIGAQRYAQLRHRKLCTLKLACREQESHGKHGREKRTTWSLLARQSEGWRERAIQFLETN